MSQEVVEAPEAQACGQLVILAVKLGGNDVQLLDAPRGVADPDSVSVLGYGLPEQSQMPRCVTLEYAGRNALFWTYPGQRVTGDIKSFEPGTVFDDMAPVGIAGPLVDRRVLHAVENWPPQIVMAGQCEGLRFGAVLAQAPPLQPFQVGERVVLALDEPFDESVMRVGRHTLRGVFLC